MNHPHRLELVALSLCLAFDAAAAPPVRAKAVIENLPALYEAVAPAVVKIEVLAGPGMTGVGSGVLIHANGFVVTAAHVVESAVAIHVTFEGVGVRDAVVATLSRTEDLALLKVDNPPKGVSVPALGDSAKLEVGEAVFAVGAPLGLEHTLTTGNISAIRNDFGSELSFYPRHVIQTDAALNQGNSGGAVFNSRGEVIGIVSFIATPSHGSVGLGFAIPSNSVRRRLFEDAIPDIGVSLRRIPKPLAEVLNWPVNGALLVENVRPGTPAAEAGLKGGGIEAEVGGIPLSLGGDLIIKVGPYDMADGAKIHAYLHSLKSGESIPYTILRAGRPVEINVTVDKLIDIPQLPPLPSDRSGPHKKT